MTTSEVLLIAGAGVAALVLGGSVSRSRANPDGRLPRWPFLAAPLAGAALVASLHGWRLGTPRWSDDATLPLAVAAAAALVAAAAASAPTLPRSRAVAIGAVVAGFAAWRVLLPGTEMEWRDAHALRWGAFAALCVWLLGTFTGALLEGCRTRGPGIALRLGIVAALAGVVAIASSYAKYAEGAAFIAAAIASGGIALLFRRDARFGPGLALAVTAGTATILCGAFFHILADDRAPTGAFVLAALALPVACAPLPWREDRPIPALVLARWLVLLALAAGAASWSIATMEPIGDEDTQEWEYDY